MNSPWITIADPADVRSLARDLRLADVQEITASAGVTPERGLLRSLADSAQAWSASDAEGTFAMWGVGAASALATEGSPWLLAADRLTTQHRRTFVRESRLFVQHLRRQYTVLRNYVDARNTASVRWLRALGFTILPAEPYGVAGLPFHPFYLRTN